MKVTRKNLRILSVIFVGIVLGIVDGVVRIIIRVDISRIIVNSTIFLSIFASSILISRFLIDDPRKRWILTLFNFVLMYLIYWFAFGTILMRNFGPESSW